MRISRSMIFLSLLTILLVVGALLVERMFSHRHALYTALTAEEGRILRRTLHDMQEKQPVAEKALLHYKQLATNHPAEPSAVYALFRRAGLDKPGQLRCYLLGKRRPLALKKWLPQISEGSHILSLRRKGIRRTLLVQRNGTQVIFLLGRSNQRDNIARLSRIHLLEVISLLGGGFLLVMFLANQVVSRLAAQNRLLDAELTRLRIADQQTGLYNRIHFMTVLNEEIGRSQRYQTPFALAVFNIDGLRMINDFFGREAGDLVIRESASFVAERIRTVDRLFYLGNGQYALILPNTSLSGGFILTERLRSLIESASFPWGEKELAVTLSFGLTELDVEKDTISDLINRAENLMLKAKRSGRNRVC